MKLKFKILIIIGLTAVCFLFAAVSHLLLLPFLALAGFIAAEWGAGLLIPIIAAVAAGTLLPFGPSAGSWVEAAYLSLVPILLAVYGRKGFPHRWAVFALAVILTAGFYLSMTLGSILAGEPPYTGAVAFWNEAIVGSIVSASESSGGVLDQFAEAFAEFAELIPDLIMPACIAAAEILSVMVLLFFRLFSRLFKKEPAKMAPIGEWRLPRTAIPGSLILIAAIAAVYIAGLGRANSAAISLGLIVVSLFSLQGLAYFLFVFGATKAPGGVRAVFFVLISLLFPYSLLFLAFFGVREQISPRRTIMKKYMREMEEKRSFASRGEEYDKYGYVREDINKPSEEKDNEKKEDE